ncbi:MAG: CBS domain-containing protein [Nitrospinae bacterium]|nr:CBS domain-containing protein [Nitrospinota bacterium]
MKSIRLLIVDENDKNRGFVKDLLYESDLSFEVDEANTSLLALDKLKANGYDCVLTNYIIPGVSGLDVMKYARGFEVNIPFIVFTNYGDAELAEELIKQGVTAFLFDEEWNVEDLQYKINAAITEDWQGEIKLDEAKIKDTTIGKLMSSPPHYIDSDSMVEQVINKMKSSRVGSLLVKKDEVYVGIITKNDLIRKAIAQKLPRDSTKVSVLMTTSILSLASDTSSLAAYDFMKNRRVRHLAITENGSIVGVLSVKDLIQR